MPNSLFNFYYTYRPKDTALYYKRYVPNIKIPILKKEVLSNILLDKGKGGE